MAKKQPLKQGEKILFGIFGAFLVLAVLAYAALETVRLRADKPMFETKTSYALSEEGKRGSLVFREARCTSCHRAMRNGTNMGLNLDGIGTRHDRQWILAFLRDPEDTYGNPTLDHGAAPKEASFVAQLPEQDLAAIATFLSELKSEQGSASAWRPPEEDSGFIDSMVRMWAPAEWGEKYQDVRELPADGGAGAEAPAEEVAK